MNEKAFGPGMNREHLKALWDAYFRASGLPEATASHRRIMDLKEIDRRGITPAEIEAVVSGIRRAIEEGRRNFTPESLEWSNVMAKADKLEDRVGRYRKAMAARNAGKRKAAKADAAQPAEAPVSEEEKERLRAQRKAAIAELEARLKR